MAGSITVKAATLVKEDEDDDEKTSLVIVNGRAISDRFGHNRDSASANSLSCGLTEALAGTGIRTAEGKGEAMVERC